MAERMTIDGACHCGAIRCEADIDPDNVVLCHCTDCQTFSSAPYRASVPVLAQNLRLEGTPKEYVKTGGSGARVAVAFCGTCGTALYSTAAAPNERTRFNLRLGWVRQRAELPPKRQGFCRSALPWAYNIGDVPKVPEKR